MLEVSKLFLDIIVGIFVTETNRLGVAGFAGIPTNHDFVMMREIRRQDDLSLLCWDDKTERDKIFLLVYHDRVVMRELKAPETHPVDESAWLDDLL